MRSKEADVYAQIETDLKDAVSKMPVTQPTAKRGRATKGSALSLLGKVYLTTKRYADAVTTLKQVLTLGYSLMPTYAEVFDPAKKNNAESIFEIQYQGDNDLGEWSSFTYTFAPIFSEGAVTGYDVGRLGWPQYAYQEYNQLLTKRRQKVCCVTGYAIYAEQCCV